MRIGTRLALVRGVVVAGLIAQIGCGGAGNTPEIAVVGDPAAAVNVVVSPAPADVDLGQTKSFTATVSGASDTGVIWAVNDVVGGNSTVGTVVGSGNTVTYTAPDNAGDFVLTATSSVYSTRRGSTVVRVKGSNVAVSLSPGTGSLLTGASLAFTAAVSGMGNGSVVWSVDGVTNGNTTVGTITGSGNTVSYKAPAVTGSHVLRATSVANASKSATASITVTAPPPPPAVVSVALSSTSASLSAGSAQSFTATVSGSTNTAVTWKVDGVANGNTTVGTITGTGNTVSYTAPATAGSHTLTAISAADTSKSAAASITVTVPPPPVVVSVALSSTSASLTAGSTKTITATVSGSSNTAVTWKVDGVANGNTTVGTITGTGNSVTYTAPATAGSHTLTAISAADTSKSATASIIVTVPPPPVVVSVALSSTSASLTAGGTKAFTATVSGSSNTAVIWKVDGVANGNTTVGTITGTGNSVTYTAPATAGSHTLTTISAADTTKSAAASITVTVPPPPAVVSVILSSTAANLTAGSAQPFTATVSGSSNTDVTWKVDGVTNGDTTVGTITGSGNTVTYTAPAAAGSHTLTAISAADTSKQASAAVTVQAVQGGCAPAPTSPLVVSVKTYGAKGDGLTDDTAAIQAAIEVVAGTGGTLLVPDGTYMINAILNNYQGLQLRSNMTFRMSSGAVLKAIPNGSANYSILLLPRVSNVNIIGGTLEGDRSTHTGTGGESGMGIFVASSQNVYIEGVTAKECWGDGFYVGGSAGTTNITLCNVVADHNRRQGLSVVYADGVVVKNSTFKNTQGTLPEAGIDIEPNAGETVANMQILGCTFTNNSGGGIQNGLALGDRGIAFAKNVLIDGNVMVGNGFNAANGQTGGGGVEISNTSGHRVTNNVMRDNKNWGLRMRDEADNNTVTGNTITGTQGDGIYLDPTITGYTITGNSVTGSTRYGIYLGSGSQGTLSGNTLSGNAK